MDKAQELIGCWLGLKNVVVQVSPRLPIAKSEGNVEMLPAQQPPVISLESSSDHELSRRASCFSSGLLPGIMSHETLLHPVVLSSSILQCFLHLSQKLPGSIQAPLRRAKRRTAARRKPCALSCKTQNGWRSALVPAHRDQWNSGRLDRRVRGTFSAQGPPPRACASKVTPCHSWRANLGQTKRGALVCWLVQRPLQHPESLQP